MFSEHRDNGFINKVYHHNHFRDVSTTRISLCLSINLFLPLSLSVSFYQSLWASILTCHRSYQVFRKTSSVHTELKHVNLSRSANTNVYTKKYPMAKKGLQVRYYISTNAQHVLLVLLEWFLRWEVSDRTVVDFTFLLIRFVQNCLYYPYVVPI